MWLFYQYPGEQIKARQRSPLYEMDGVGLFGHWILHGMDSEHSLSNKGENEERNLYKNTASVRWRREKEDVYKEKHLWKADYGWRRHANEEEEGGKMK